MMPTTAMEQSNTIPSCCGDGNDNDNATLDSWTSRGTPPSPLTTVAKKPELPQHQHRSITRSLTPSITTRHHRPIVMQHSSSFPPSIESSLATQTQHMNRVENEEEEEEEEEENDDDSLAFRTRLDIADYPPSHPSTSSTSSSSSLSTPLLHPMQHRPRTRPCAIITSHEHIAPVPLAVTDGHLNHHPSVVPNTPTRERLNTTDTSATIPSYNTSSMLLLMKNNNIHEMTMNARFQYMDNDATHCHELAHGVATPLHFAREDVGTYLKTSKMANRTFAQSNNFPESFTENYADDGKNVITTAQTTNATTEIFHSPPPPYREGGRDRRKGSFYNDNDDLASDVSSLTDALSFQHEDGKIKNEKKKINDYSATKVDKGANIERRHPFAGMRSRSKSTTAIATASSSEASPVRNASPSTTNPISMAATLLRKPKVLQRVRSLRVTDTSAAAASKSVGLNEGFDHSLEQQLFVEHIVGREHHRSPRPSLVGRGTTIYQSPLGEAIDREKISSSSRRLKLSSSSSQNSRSTSSSTTMSQQRSRLALRSGKSQSSSSRRHHSPLPGDEGSAYPSARRHRRTHSDGNRVTATTGIESLWVSNSSPPSLGARASTTTGIQNTSLVHSSTLPPLMRAEVARSRPWHSKTPPEDTRPIPLGKTSSRLDEDLIDITYDEPVDPFSGLIGMPPSIIGCGSDDIFGFPTISSSCSSGGDIDNNSSLPSSSWHSISGMRPPSGKRTPNRIAQAFDPLLVGEGCGDGKVGMEETSSSSIHSPLRPCAIPPRHYKDDPLLANSTYRQPMWMRSPTSSEQSRQIRPTLTLRSTSLGSGLNNGNPSIGCNTCILGTIAQLEVSTPRGLKEGTAAVRFGNSSQSLNDTGHSSCDPGTTSGATTDKSSRTTHTTLPLDKSHDEQDYDDVNVDEEEDNGSCRSFTEEYHRREQKHKGVLREVKHILGLGAVGKNLFRRGSEGAKLRRADGCLT